MSKILFGEEARKASEDILASDDYSKEQMVAGYFIENSIIIGFDNTDGDCYVEEFYDIREAIKYYEGEVAIDRNGNEVG